MRLMQKLDRFRPGRSRTPVEWYRLAVKLGNEGRVDDALEALCSAARGEPDDPELWVAIGRSFTALGDARLAVGALETACELDPANAGAHVHLGLALLDSPATEEAVEHLQRAEELGLDDVDMHRGLARAHARLGDVAACARRWRKVVALAPDDIEAQSALGTALSTIGSHAEALEILELVALVNPQSPQHVMNFGVANYRDGNLIEAEKFFEMALEIDPSSAEAWSNLGAVLLEKGQPEEARDALLKAAAISPQNREIREACARLMIAESPARESSLRERSVITGDVSQFAIPDLLQVLEGQHASGVLTVERPGRQVIFTFKNGSLLGGCNVVLSSLKEVMPWKEGQFTFFRRDVDDDEEDITERIDARRALLEAACELDEGARTPPSEALKSMDLS